MSQTIKLEKSGYVVEIILNRPDQLNAFNYEMLLELSEVLHTVHHDKSIRVVVFRGSGNRAFSVGADLKERKTLSEAEVIRNVTKIGEVFSQVANLPQPTIAAVSGYAFGGGMELLLSCDFRIVAKGVQMGLTETSLAIIPGAGGTQRLPRIVGEAKALELILTARRFTSEEAMEWGLVTKLADSLQFDTVTNVFIEQLLKNGPVAVKQAKLAIKKGLETTLENGLQIEREAYMAIIPTDDRKEALVAFSEKRAPNFIGK
ncbi:enoyl-CoA hydratase [Bacillus coahuilensis p1.1.43]|uniref:Enoyl-CoA hydratase n=1 Tax=Bacillus coahuilensis p1.1.43 TaxID=1150625 RepID=A0A147KAN4_9BACI|nr:enoyl-CoA hydratase-related protein [Bacillus coahuilensis]KUP07722.1 enoyl-CoA hydratase [Bacillus coahuilensis p1.1.43]